MQENSNGGGSIALVLMFLGAAWFWDLWPFTGGEFRPFDYKHDYHVYFYMPEGASQRERYLGRVTGLDQCNAEAVGFANEHRLSRASWSYVCCSIRKGSQCYEKER